MKPDSQYVKKLVDKGRAVMTCGTQHTPSRKAVDGPVLGNGDMGAVIRTQEDGYVFLLGKNDFWRQPYLYETKKQRRERLLGGTNRRTGGRPIPAGWIRLKFDGMYQTKFHMVQNPYDAKVAIDMPWGDGQLVLKSWICAVRNTLAIEIENRSEKDAAVDFSIMPGEYDVYEVDGYEDGYTENAVWFTYGAEPYNVPGKRCVGVAASCSCKTEYCTDRMAQKGGIFTVKAGDNAKLLLTMLSDLDADNPGVRALEENAKAMEDVDNMRRKHELWWKKFWEKSVVETGDETLDSYYYSSLYWLGSCTGEGKVPPAILGCWVTSNLAYWSGAYTLNYNFQSPFFCLYTSNRQELVTSYIDPLLDIIPIGEMYAREKFGHRGICLPVEIGPWGMVCSGQFFGQKTNAAYCCVNIFMHYFSTFDREWGLLAYPFVKKTAQFWEDDLVYENGVYNVVGDCAHEEVSPSDGERNNIHALGLVKMLFDGILKMSRDLGLDEESGTKWRDIASHLPEFPHYVRNGQKVFKYNEDSYEWRDANGTPVKFIYPFGCIGLDSDKELLETARNTLEQKDYLFFQMNAFCEYFQMRARVNADADKTYRNMIEGCKKLSFPNRYMTAHGGGIEDFNAIPGGINEMMLQGHEGVVRVFPSWPVGKDAKFMNLRSYGAFLVSSQIKGNEILYVEVISEKGRRLTFQNPWDCADIMRNGVRTGTLREERITIDTQPGDIILLKKSIIKSK